MRRQGAVEWPSATFLWAAFSMATWILARGMMEPSILAKGVSHAARFSGISTSFRRLFLLFAGGRSITR